MFKVQTTLVQAMRAFLTDRAFIEIHSPKLIGAASESGSDVFEVRYFDRSAYLAQSPQFYKQMAMAAGFEKIFEAGPVFRAEKSFTSKHATEFTGFDLKFFKYGCPPHGGFGLGIDRLTMLLLGLHIKEAAFIFRGPNRLNP